MHKFSSETERTEEAWNWSVHRCLDDPHESTCSGNKLISKGNFNVMTQFITILQTSLIHPFPTSFSFTFGIYKQQFYNKYQNIKKDRQSHPIGIDQGYCPLTCSIISRIQFYFYLPRNPSKVVTSVTRRKSPNVYKSCPKMISLEK